MEFRNLLSDVPSGLLDNYANLHNAQQYWIKDKENKKDYVVYKGSFPNKERKVMTCSREKKFAYNKWSFCIDGTKIAEKEVQECPCLRLSNDRKLYATKSFDNVSLRRYDSVVSHNTDLMQLENVKEMDLISDITMESSFCEEKVVVANPYFKSVKSYKDYAMFLVKIASILMLLIMCSLLFLGLYVAYADIRYVDSSSKIVVIPTIISSFCAILFVLPVIYVGFRYLCKGEKREVLLELVGIDDESPYATVSFKWESSCLESKPYEIICHRDIDLKQLLTLVAVSVRSMIQ